MTGLARPGALLVVGALFLGTLSGCRHCGSHSEVAARLDELHGPVSKELAAQPQSWQDAPQGATFAMGDAVRTQTGATATVSLTAGGRVQLTELTIVRFREDGAHSRQLAIETGEAEVEPGGSAIGVETMIGMAEVEAGSRVKITRDGQSLMVDVLIGGAEFDSPDGGAKRVVKAGHHVEVTIGGAGVEMADKEVGAPPAKAPVDAGVPHDAEALRDAVAEGGLEPLVVEIHGNGVKASASRTAALQKVEEGKTTLAPGSHLVVPTGATVTLSRGGDGLTVLGGTDVEIGAEGGPVVRVASGRVLVTSQTPGTSVEVPGGSVDLVTVGTGRVQADVRVERKAARVLSNRGELSLHGKVRTARVGPGESGTLDAKGDATADAVTAVAADVSIPAGESATVHSPTGTAAVQLRRTDCSGDSLVQITSGTTVRRTFARADDPTTGILQLPAGRHEYVVSCVDTAAASPDQRGSVSVARDLGLAHIARTAATNVADADGRHYHVLYESVLPQMTFHWPDAPATGAITFHASGPGGTDKRTPAPSGKVVLPAGAMAEGTYVYWFDVDGHPKLRSPDTTLGIAFDNAAPAAEIHSPTVGQPLSPTIHVSGVAVESSTVSVSGVALPLDGQWRFSGDVPAPPAEHAVLAVRITHPVRGTHYFIRTFAAASAP